MASLFSSYVLENYWKKGIWTLDLGYTKEEKDTSPLLKRVEECKLRPAQVYFYDDCSKVAIFGSGHYYSLKMYGPIPILEIDGLRMHLMKDWESPIHYARSVASFISKGKVLDTCAGLGYISIELARKGCDVTSIEISKEVLEIAGINPFSKDMFKLSRVLRGDSFELIDDFRGLDAIVHDPPRFSHAPLLYSRRFYEKCFYSLKEGGLFYHYVGSFGASKGRDQLHGVEKRLRSVGFSQIKKLPKHQAVLAVKKNL